tara:strand:- start:567 stop:779 length:213 start_codon:yes stop_codon:yes gene_type:complete
MIGLTIVDIENLNDNDKKMEGWEDETESSAVLVLSDGTRIYASRDYEGNGSGALFARLKKKVFTISVKGG